MRTLTLRQGSTLSSLVQVNRVNLMLFAMRTISPGFFGNIHGYIYQLSINETHAFLYLFCYHPKSFALKLLVSFYYQQQRNGLSRQRGC